jgi:hypothetical protein
MAGDLSNQINQETPLAPADTEAVAERLRDSAHRGAPAPGSAKATPVFVPTSSQESGEVAYQLRELEQGIAGLAVYTSPKKLLRELGHRQTYVEVEIIELLRQVSGRAPLLVDPILRVDEKLQQE